MKFRSYTRKMSVSLALVMMGLLLGGASNAPDHEKQLGGRTRGAILTMTFSEIQWQERSWYVEEKGPEVCLMLVCMLSGGCHANVATNKKQKTIQVREGGHATVCRDVVTFSDS